MSPEDRLAAFLAEDDTPSPTVGDPMFVVTVMQGVARRELGLKLASGAAMALAAGAVLWACAPVLNLAVQSLAPTLAPAAGVLTLAAAVSLLGVQILDRR